MIFDGDEVLSLGTDPLSPDTDNNGISDADEDLDTDGLSNMCELLLGTNPLARDSDNDKITDGDEINKYKIDPLKSDTDGDNAEDGWEIKNEYDPLIANSSFNVTLTAEDEENNLNASVTVEVIGSQVESLNAEFLENTFYMNPTIPGYIGKGLELSVDDEVDDAELEFTFDESLLENEDFIPTIYYYNEDTQCLEELETTTVGNISKAYLKHFSTYILLNKIEFEKIWENEIRLPSDDATLRNLKVSFVVDCSGSMWDSVATTKEVLKTFVNILHEDDQVSLVTFEPSADVVCNFSADKSVVNNAINSVYAGGGTAIYTGLSAAENLFDNNDEYDNLIILITDGEDSYSVDYDNTYVPIINNANDGTDNHGHITIYTIGVGDYIDTNLLNKIAGGTHGSYYHATAISNLQEQIENIQGEMIDYTKDSNDDDISDYYTKKLTSGELRYGTHAYVFGTYDENGKFYPATYEEVQDNKDFDNDHLINGQEIQVDTDSLGHPYVKFQTDPSNEDSDKDGDTDYIDPNPLKYCLNGYFIMQLQNIHYLAEIYNDEKENDLYTTNKDDWLTVMFLRSLKVGKNGERNYDSTLWTMSAGEIDENFIHYVQSTFPNLYEYFQLTPKIYAYSDSGKPTDQWETIDLYHMAGTMSALIFYSTQTVRNIGKVTSYVTQYITSLLGSPITLSLSLSCIIRLASESSQAFEPIIDDLLGWAGDLKTLMNDIKQYGNTDESYQSFYNAFFDFFGNEQYQFSYEDLYGDIDAWNIYNASKDDNMINSFNNYYCNKYKYRFNTFINNRNVDELKSYIETYTNKFLWIFNWPLFNYTFSQEESNAARDAFAYILFDLAE